MEKCLFEILCGFIFLFYYWVLRVHYILDTSLLSDMMWKRLLLYGGLSPHFLEGTICSTHIFNFIKSDFFLSPWYLGGVSKKELSGSRSRRFPSVSPSKSVTVTALTLGCVIHFWANLCMGRQERGRLYSLASEYPVTLPSLFGKANLPHAECPGSLAKSFDCKCKSSLLGSPFHCLIHMSTLGLVPP